MRPRDPRHTHRSAASLASLVVHAPLAVARAIRRQTPPLPNELRAPADARHAAAIRARLTLLRRLRAGAFLALAAIAGALVLAVAVGMYLARGTPAWWPKASVGSDDDAQSLENAVVAQLSAIRPTDPAATASEGDGPAVPWRSESWTVALSEADANAWLRARLKVWLANRNPPVRWPREIEDVRVRFFDGGVHVGASLIDDGTRRVVSATIAPDLRVDGTIWAPARGVDVGALPMPPGIVLGWVRDTTDHLIPGGVRQIPELPVMLDAFAGSRPMFRDAAIRVDSGRRVRLLSLRARSGWVEITCRTEASDPRPRNRPETVRVSR